MTQWILIYRTVYEPQQEQDCLRGSQILSLSRPCSKGQRPPTPNTCPVWSLGHTLTQIMETLQPITFSSKSRGCVLSHEWEQGKLGEAAGPMLWLKGQLLLHSLLLGNSQEWMVLSASWGSSTQWAEWGPSWPQKQPLMQYSHIGFFFLSITLAHLCNLESPPK